MEHMNREVIQFIQMLGHTDVFLRCDNEPSILQLKRLLVKTRQAMGLRTLESSAVAYDHGNSLAENAVGRVRPLAASLMHQLHGRLGIQLSTSSAVWTWALRHASWILSRFAVVRGATAYMSLLLVDPSRVNCASLVNQCLDMWFQIQKPVQSGKG